MHILGFGTHIIRADPATYSILQCQFLHSSISVAHLRGTRRHKTTHIGPPGVSIPLKGRAAVKKGQNRVLVS